MFWGKRRGSWRGGGMCENHFCAFKMCPFFFFSNHFCPCGGSSLPKRKPADGWPGGPAPLALDAGIISPLQREYLSLPHSIFLAAAPRDGGDTAVALTTPLIFWLSSLPRLPFPATRDSQSMQRWEGKLFSFPTKKRSHKQQEQPSLLWRDPASKAGYETLVSLL